MNEKDYSRFDLGDFAADQCFVSWVIYPDEKNEAFWSKWLEENPGKGKMLHEARLLVLLMRSRTVRLHETQKELLWQRIQAQTVEKDMPQQQRAGSARSVSFSFYKIAASITLILVASAAAYFFALTDRNNMIVENPRGKKSVVYLEDGSTVWLNADSKLSYASSFAGEKNRTVELEGEAFFDVVEDPAKPFIVKTGELQVKVLGTAFNVKAFKADNKIETTLLRGRVEVVAEDADKSAILTPNQQAVYVRGENAIEVANVQPEQFASWKDGELTFNNTPFSEMKTTLERWYGVEIIVGDEAGSNCRFSSQFQNEPISVVLELLKETSGIEYVINGNTITIKGSLCQTTTKK